MTSLAISILALLAAGTTPDANTTSVTPKEANQDMQSTASRASEVATQQDVDFDDQDDKVICRRDKETGSRVRSRKVCKTAKQWEADRIEARNTVEKGQNQRMLTNHDP